MHIHIALFRWRTDASSEDISRALADIEALAAKVPGIVEIKCAANRSQYSEGYSHVVLVRAESQAAMDAYRAHPDHQDAAARIEAMEAAGVGVDFYY